MSGYLALGVDGGGTKSDYALCSLDGRLLDWIRGGPANHEVTPGGFPAAATELRESIGALLERNGAEPSDLAATAFGIAGADLPPQVRTYEAILRSIGIEKPIVCNDSFLGVKAGTSSGVGLCSINGTGTSVAAIDPSGRRIQVGGIGRLSGDDAGASYLAAECVRLAYSELFRCGERSAATGPVLLALGVDPSDELGVVGAIHGFDPSDEGLVLGIVRILFEAARDGDAPALRLLRESGVQMARSLAGAFRRLDFSGVRRPEVVIAGSVSLKGSCAAQLEAFEAESARLVGRELEFIRLREPPVLGALLWALEAAGAAAGPGERESLAAGLASFARAKAS